MPKVFVLAILLTLFSMGECEQRQVKITKSGTPAFLQTDVNSLLNGQLLQDLFEGSGRQAARQDMRLVKNVLRSGAIVSCQAATYPNARFYGTLIAMGTVQSAADCAAACWSANLAGQTCKAANYDATSQQCELFQNDIYTGGTMYVEYNVMVMMQIQCQQADDNEPTPAPEPAPAPQPQGSDIPAGTCGKNAFPLRAQRKLNRIVGGEEAIKHSIPWLISIRPLNYGHICGGTLIRVRPDKEETDIVVTAAHCAASPPALKAPRPYTVTAGAHYRNMKEPGEVTVTVAKEIVHESYNSRNQENDILILKLATPIKFSNTIQPACLPGKDEGVAPGTYGTLAGWGDLFDGAKQGSDKLMQVYIPVVDDNTCQQKYVQYSEYGYRISSDVMMCGEAAGKDSCQGDSGGPYFFQGKNGYTLQGVVSWGEGCAKPNLPGAYTRVTKYLDWIQNKIQLESDVYKS